MKKNESKTENIPVTEKTPESENTPEKEKKKKSPLFIILIIILSGTLIFSGYKVITIASGYYQDDQSYKEITQDNVSTDVETFTTESGGTITDSFLKIDYEALKAQNKDYIAWINIPSTKVSYPVVNAKDYKQYLHKRFDGVTAFAGTIFTDYRCKKNFA